MHTDFTKGKWVCAGFLYANMIFALCLRLWLQRQNRLLDELATETETAGTDSVGMETATENYGSRFRYIL